MYYWFYSKIQQKNVNNNINKTFQKILEDAKQMLILLQQLIWP